MSLEPQPSATDIRQKIADLLVMPGTEDLELEIPRMGDLAQAAELP
jgi:hypothetical protein